MDIFEKLRRRDFLTIAPALIAAPRVGAALRPPTDASSEARAIWLHPESIFDADPAKGKVQVNDWVRRLAEAHFNLILPWTTAGYLAALGYPEYLAANPTARWDAHGFFIEQASRAGLGAHLWYAFTEYRSRECPDFNPRTGGDPRWAARRINELVPDPKTGKVAPRKWEDVCPQHPEARRWQINLLQRAFRRYPALKGVHIEEPGYTYLGNCVCDLCQEVFPKLYGKPLPPAIDDVEADDFRCVGTTAFMRELAEVLTKDHPRFVFSTNGAYDWRPDRKKGRDWVHWAALGWLDYYAPQIYFVKNEAAFRQRLKFTMDTLGNNSATYAGIRVGGKTVPRVIAEIEASREMGAAGTVLFLGDVDVISAELHEALRSGPFRSPAVLPKHRILPPQT